MRENTKIILWVVVIAFVITIFAVWGLDLQSGSMQQKQNLVGRVNGVPVTPQDYQQTYTQISQQYRAQSAGDLTAAQQEMVRQQAWDNIVSNILTTEEIKRLGIGVTDDEVLKYLRTSPPPEVQQYFKAKDGSFDFAAYQAALNNPEADWTAVENLARQRIPVLKLNQYLMAQVHVSAADVKRAFEEENVKMIAEYVEFPIEQESVGEWSASDADVKAFYDAHTDRFQDTEKAVLEYVRIPIEPSARDRSDLVFSAAQIRGDAAGDFAGAAKTYSESHTATVGGETGLISRSQRDEAVMKAVDALKPGEVSPPVTTPDGVYLVQLIATKREKGETKYNLREIFLKLSAGSETTDSLSAIAQDIQKRATESGDLAATAKAAGLEVQNTGPFAQGIVPGLGYAPSVSRFAFASEAGRISGVISDDRNYYVCRVVSRVPASTRALADVAESIKLELLHDRQTDLAVRRAEAFRKSAAPPDANFAKVATQYGYKAAKTDSFTVVSPPPQTGPPLSAFARAALMVEPGGVTAPVENGNSVFIVRLIGRREPATSVFKSRAPEMLEQLRQQKIQDYVMYWYNDLKERGKIEDLRQAF